MLKIDNKLKMYVLAGVCTVLICISAFIRIPLPFGNAFTLQTFFVVFTGIILGSYYGGFSVFIYLLMGLIGIPVFTSGGGLHYVFSPTFGYLVGFIITAMLAGFLIKRFKKKNFFSYLVTSIVALLPTHVLGIIYLYVITKFYTGNSTTFNPEISFFAILLSNVTTTIPIDILKAVLVSIVAPMFIKVLNKSQGIEVKAQ